MGKNYGPMETSAITSDEYDIIHAEGYANCLRDMITNIENMVKLVDEHELDLETELLKLVGTARDTLAEENTDLQ